MKADMRVPTEPGGQYLLVIEAETELEKGALAHFGVEAQHAARELRVMYMAPGKSKMFGDAPSCVAIFVATDARKAYTPIGDADAPVFSLSGDC